VKQFQSSNWFKVQTDYSC